VIWTTSETYISKPFENHILFQPHTDFHSWVIVVRLLRSGVQLSAKNNFKQEETMETGRYYNETTS
jgi:hypothetical protein